MPPKTCPKCYYITGAFAQKCMGCGYIFLLRKLKKFEY